MEEIVEPFREYLQTVQLNAPRLPFISCLSGTWIEADQAMSAEYWAQQLRHPVRFAEGVQRVLEQPRCLLEAGPGQVLSALTRQVRPEQRVIASMRAVTDRRADQEVLLEALGQLWVRGQSVDWQGFYANEQRHRVVLPTYAFDRQRYWIDAPTTAAPANERRPVDEWFYAPIWKQAVRGKAEPVAAGDPWLVFLDTGTLGARVVQRLRQRGHRVCTVTAGSRFQALDESAYTVEPGCAEDYSRLLDALHQHRVLPQHIAHLWSVDAAQDFATAQRLGFFSLLYLAQALGQRTTPTSRLQVISRHVHEVTGEETLEPGKATVLGPCMVIGQEYPQLRCTHVDIDEALDEEGLNALMNDLESPGADAVVAYRGRRRWIRGFEPVRLPASTGAVFRQGGTYLITGGMGGIGLALAEHLARNVTANLVLTGLSAVPERGDWNRWLAEHDANDRTSVRLRKLVELEALGAQVLAASVDVSDGEAMRNLIERAERRFGRIHGVVHAAGNPGGGLIQRRTPEAIAAVFNAKIGGVEVLEKLIDLARLDFMVAFSSTAALVGGVGQVDYVAANAFIDAWAVARARSGVPVRTINWNTWKETGMAARAFSSARADLRARLESDGIETQQGIDAFTRILHQPEQNLVISPRHFDGTPLGSVTSEMIESTVSRTSQERPDGLATYVPPVTALEKEVVSVFEECLGISGLGIHDDFFESGGDSLIAAKVRNDLQKGRSELLHVASIYEASTPAKLAKYLEENYGESPNDTFELESRVDSLRALLQASASNPAYDLPKSAKAGPALFVLCSPRSGSTLLRIMLGVHPRLFAPPEMGLLLHGDFESRRRALSEIGTFWNEGLLQAISSLKHCSTSEASAELARLCEGRTSTHSFVIEMQSWLGNRLLVDKTPGYAMHPWLLQHLEMSFTDARYIHLVRHPTPSIRSYEEARLDLLIDAATRAQLSCTRREFAEAIWGASNDNIISFLSSIPKERRTRIKYEDLVTDPDKTLSSVCDMLGIERVPSMMYPYGNKQAIVGGLSSDSRMIGDHKFNSYDDIVASKADAWRRDPSFELASGTRRIAASCGYDDVREPLKDEVWQIV